MSYTIKLEQGKYLIRNDNGSLTILRNGEDWPAAEELKHVKLVGSLAARIQELEETVRNVVDGSLVGDVRYQDGTSHFLNRYSPPQLIHVKTWETTLRNVLEQK